jgi:hypothetical protein
LGYFREDYQFTAPTAANPDYLDEHNGRFCLTPEYPAGTYAYFCTVDENLNSAYPYAVGPTFYGTYANRKVTSITEATTIYTPVSTGLSSQELESLKINVFPNPGTEFLAIQTSGLLKEDLDIRLYQSDGKEVNKAKLLKGHTNTFMNVENLYNGVYTLKVKTGKVAETRQVLINR